MAVRSLSLLSSVASLIMLLAIFDVHPSLAHPRKLMKSTKKSTFASLGEVKQYLQAYGYIKSSKDPNGATDGTLTTELSLEHAIRSYQEFNNLEVTGKLESKTAARMMTPRCGLPDIIRKRDKGVGDKSRMGKVQVVADYSFPERMDPWTQSELTYTFTSTIPSVSLNNLRAICSRAFQRWAAVSPFNFREAGYGEVANIKIGFYFGDHGDNKSFDGPGHVWAHAFYPQDGRLHHDGSENWSTSTPTMVQVDLESITVHEIGHTLGLAHSSDRSAIMYPYISPGVVKRELQPDDINGIRALYSSK